MSSIAKSWKRTGQIYGQPMVVHEYAYCNGRHLLHCHDHPQSERYFDTNIISLDFDHWMHIVCSPPERIEELTDLHICNNSDSFVAVGLSDEKQFIAYTSTSGHDWEQMYVSPDKSPNHCPTTIKFLGGALIAPCVGHFKYSIDAKHWVTVPFREPYASYEVLDVTYFKSNFFFLLRKGETYAFAYTANTSQIDYYTVAWMSQIKPTSLSAGDNQMIVSAGENAPEFATLLVTDTGKTPDSWDRIKIKMPYNDIGNSVATLYDALWHNGEWIIAGTTQEWNNVRTFLFSSKGLVLRCSGDISPSTKFELDNIVALDLRKLYFTPERIVALGQAWPTSDNCLFEIAT